MATKRKMKKKMAPSRVKYEAEHPTVCSRVDCELRGKLEAICEEMGISFSAVLRLGLEKGVETILAAHNVGYLKAATEKEYLYKVTYPCNICGETIELTSEKAKKAATEYMVEHGWGHGKCHKK